MKSKIKFFTPNDKANSASDVIRHQIRQTVKDANFWWGVFFLLSLLFLFVLQIESPVPNYNVGEIAHSTVRATQDIQVPDTLSTERKRREAEERVLPVYDYEAGLVNSSIARMDEIFNYLRQLQVHDNKADWQNISQEIQSRWKIFVDPSFLAVASKKDFSQELQKYLSQRLRDAMVEYIITDRKMLLLGNSQSVTIRDRSTGHEESLNANSLKDLQMVNQSTEAELRGDPSLDASEVIAFSKFLSTFVVPTVYYNSAETESRMQTSGHNAEPVFYQIKKGKVIVRDGEEVTPAIVTQLKILRDSRRSGLPIRYSIGILILLAISLISLRKYLNAHQHSDIKLRNKSIFQLCGLVLVIHVMLIKLGFLIAFSLSTVFPSSPLNVLLAYQVAIPFAAGALLLTILTGRQIATIYCLAFTVLIGVITRGDFYLAFYSLASGFAAAFSIRRYYQRSALLRSCFWIWLANLLTVFMIHLLREMPLNWNEMLFHTLCTFISAMLSAAIASVLSPIMEWMFNITTDIKLLELSNLDLPVLRQLALEAPGTYHHSIVMGTIAEAAAEKVRANPVFLRVAALYHDIGKIRKSEYYVENQREYNKHDTLNPRMSALVIINHVKEGLEVAKMLRLPSDLADMIPQHHGTRLITYFYKKAKDMENPEMEEVKEADYRYPGPKPQTKEAAILMLADATEAASRTLTEPSPSRLQNMVDTLFRAIFEDGQLDESDLTMKDLNLIAEAFVRKLESIFHHRISYPGYEFNKDEKRDSGESKNVSETVAHRS